MAIASLGEKFQIVVPKEIREALDLKPRDRLLLWTGKHGFEAVPLKRYKDPLKVLESLSKKQYRMSVEELEKQLERGASRQ
ncbi:AbrB/MazE/SpoVT family DNA-binding domain-containing protein [Candidatus Woesearchaeota archaeon]|nr:AbrB/MazE/SpoVT family DNA-binding domain-containing protein [Candidatus Woesearchaeota archaeon]